MALSTSPHLTDIPQAIRIAASVDPSIDPQLKQQAFDYLGKVKHLCEETWQDCLALYMQGAGAGPSSSGTGKDGKAKLETDLRMFCEQVVDEVLINKPEVIDVAAQQGMYKAVVNFVRTEYVEGSCEAGQSFLRNKLAYTLTHLFIATYPNVVSTFLHPFLELLVPPEPLSANTNLNPALLTIHILREIAQEIHDTLLKSARPWSESRSTRDGIIRDVIRSSGDEILAVKGLLALAEKGLASIGAGGAWMETTELALKTLALWTPWVDLTVSLTPESLPFYHRVLHQPIMAFRTPAATIIRTFIAKGAKDPAEKLQVLKVLDVLNLVDPLEAQTRGTDDEATTQFRVALGGVVQVYGVELIKLAESSEVPEQIRSEAEAMMSAAIPLLLRFLSDRHPEVPVSVSPFVSDLLRTLKKYSKPAPVPANGKTGAMAPPPTPIPLPPAKRQFLQNLLEVVVRQLEWPADVEWELIVDEADADEAVAAFANMRSSFRSIIDNISGIDKTLHTEVVASIVVSSLEALRTQGPSALTWQQAELAAYLVFTFGEISKSNSRAAFWELPPEVATRAARERLHRISRSKLGGDSTMSSGSSTPNLPVAGTDIDPLAVDAAFRDTKIDYEQYPLTPLGQLLTLCMTSGLASYPHPSVPLQYFEIGVRYGEFWKAKPGAIQPMFEAMLNGRGVHHPDEAVRRRCFYLVGKFVKECRQELDVELIPAILESLRDTLVVNPILPQADTPEEDVLLKATTGKSYFQDQLHLFETAGLLVYLTKADPSRQMALLGAVAGPLMAGIGSGLDRYRATTNGTSGAPSADCLIAVLCVHHYLLALGNFAKGFPPVSDDQVETLAYQPPFKQMTEALLQALDVMKTHRIVRDSARFAFSQFVSAIGSSIAELVPRFVTHVVTEFEPNELVDFMTFLNLLMHRLKKNTFETMDMLLLPLLGRIFAILQRPVTGTDEALIHRRLQDSQLSFFTSLMNANLEGVFITERNKPEFENVLSALLNLANDCSDNMSQRAAFSFFAKSVIAWGTSPEAVNGPSVFADSARSSYSVKVANGQAHPTGQHAVPKAERVAQALPGYETFIYQRLVPACFQVPADAKFNVKTAQPVLYEIAMLLRNTLQARGQEAIDFLLTDLFPKLQCPPEIANQLVQSLKTQQSKDFRKTFAEFIKAMKS